MTRKIFETEGFAVNVEFGVLIVQHFRVTAICIYLVIHSIIQKHVVDCKLCS